MKAKIILIILLASFFIQPSTANTFADFDISYQSDDNLTRTHYAKSIRKDSAIEITVDYGKFFDFENNWSMTLIGIAAFTKFSTYDALNKSKIGAAITARKKFGLGAFANAINISLSASQNNLKDNKRDNNETELSFGWSKRLTDSWAIAASVSNDNRLAKNSVFSISGTSYGISTDYAINENLLFSFGYTNRIGDINTIITDDNPLYNKPEFISQNLPHTYDNSYRTDQGFDSNAFKINALTDIFKINFSYAINDMSSINLGYENQNTKLSTYSKRYENNIISSHYLYSF